MDSGRRWSRSPLLHVLSILILVSVPWDEMLKSDWLRAIHYLSRVDSTEIKCEMSDKEQKTALLCLWEADSTLMSDPPTMSYPSYLSPNTLTMFNINNLLNQKDSRWLQLEVCREFQRQKCTRSDAECKFAHPPPNVEVQNGRVTACYDSIKVRMCIFLLFCL